MVDTRGDLRNAIQQRRSMFVPALAIPQLQAVARPDDDERLLQAGVLAEEARDHDPSRRVEVRVVGAAVEKPLQLGQPRRQGRQLRERAPGIALVVLWAPRPRTASRGSEPEPSGGSSRRAYGRTCRGRGPCRDCACGWWPDGW